MFGVCGVGMFGGVGLVRGKEDVDCERKGLRWRNWAVDFLSAISSCWASEIRDTMLLDT